MGSPDAQEYVVSIVKELVTNYPIDGINWDDEINGAGYTAGFGYPAYSQANYARSGLARYRINTGYVGTPSNTDTAWANYRRRYKNELMARVQAEIQSIKTNPRQPLRHTSAALAYSPVPGSCDFTGSTPYTYFCDWAGMLQNGWVDAVIPQTYSSSTFNTLGGPHRCVLAIQPADLSRHRRLSQHRRHHRQRDQLHPQQRPQRKLRSIPTPCLILPATAIGGPMPRRMFIPTSSPLPPCRGAIRRRPPKASCGAA